MEPAVNLTASIEQLALGELSPAEGAQIVLKGLGEGRERLREEIYLALRSCVWKALDGRRRDEDLNAWMEVVSRAASRIGEDLSPRLEAFVELLQISSMSAGVERSRDPLEGRHARRFLVILREANGRMAKKGLMRATRLKGSTLTQAMAPLIDRGLVAREITGREVEYLLTREGRAEIDRREPVLPGPNVIMTDLQLAEKYVKRGRVELLPGKVVAFGGMKLVDCYPNISAPEPAFGNAYALRADPTDLLSRHDRTKARELVA